jgi:hypothetical protein
LADRQPVAAVRVADLARVLGGPSTPVRPRRPTFWAKDAEVRPAPSFPEGGPFREWRAVGGTSKVPTSSEWMAVSTVRGNKIARLEFFDDSDAAITAAKAAT